MENDTSDDISRINVVFPDLIFSCLRHPHPRSHLYFPFNSRIRHPFMYHLPLFHPSCLLLSLIPEHSQPWHFFHMAVYGGNFLGGVAYARFQAMLQCTEVKHLMPWFTQAPLLRYYPLWHHFESSTGVPIWECPKHVSSVLPRAAEFPWLWAEVSCKIFQRPVRTV